MKVDVYTTEGKKKGQATMSDVVFGAQSNQSLLHQVVVSMMSNARTTIAYTKDRSEVRGGGKKPWKQKGTGNARHGSSRSPIWRSGGVTFGPTNQKNYTKKINKKMRAKALYVALSDKLRDKEILFVESMIFDAPKTAQAKVIMESLSSIKGYDKLNAKYNAAIILVPEKTKELSKSFSNIGNVEVKEIRNANPLDVLNKKVVVIVNPEAANDVLESRINK